MIKIMNYEKAYKEALERARELYNLLIKEGTLSTPKGIETIFPELKESEDEKIKQCIGMALTDASEQRFKDFGTTLKTCLAWLERQREKSWSEEDERMLNEILDEIYPHGECPDYPTTEEQDYYYTRQKMTDWLKSLKPRWKPT